MKNTAKRFVSIAVAAIIVFSCALSAFAAGPAVSKAPSRTVYYQGIDWVYNNKNVITLTKNDIDLAGTVISAGGKTISYRISGSIPNMYAEPESGSWAVGNNSIKINSLFNEFDGSAYTTVKFVALKNISVVTPPTRAYLVKDIDWKLGIFGDAEYTDYRNTGLTIKAVYTDGTTKTLSNPDNMLVTITAPPGVDMVSPGEVTFYADFCGKTAPINEPLTLAESLPNKLGDISKDSNINSYDALLALQHSTGIIYLDSLARTLADVNCDYKINSSDALAILKYSVGIINKF